MRILAGLLLSLTLFVGCAEDGCDCEPTLETSEVHRVVLRADFDAIDVGATEQQVRQTLGEPESVEGTRWRYRVWDGEKLGFFRMLLASSAPRGRQLFGDVTFDLGHVTARTLAPVPNDPFVRTAAPN
jgi:hypothetical protein